MVRMPSNVEVLPGRNSGDRILRFEGPLTLGSLFDVQPLLREETAGTTILDLTNVPYMDSAAVGMLVGFHVSSQRNGRKYAITGVADRIRKMLAICQVDKILVMEANKEAAEVRFASAAT